MSREESFPIYPFLIISYFFIHLYAQNFEKGLRLSFLLRPYFFTLAAAALLWLFSAWRCRSIHKGAFCTFFFAFFFFSYGHFRNLLLTYVMRMYIPQKFFIALFLLIVTVIPLWILRRSHLDFKKLAVYLNIVSGILVLFPLSSVISDSVYARPQPVKSHGEVPLFTKAPNSLPDIYYVILDEYARADVLKSDLHFDNRPFLNELKKRGFYIAEQSRSNYLQTNFSLSSSLNMRYLDSLEEDFLGLIKNNAVSYLLKKNLGYRYIFVNSGCVLSDASPTADELISSVGGNDVELLLANTTIINAFSGFFFSESWRYRHRYNFKRLGEVPHELGPKFIFAHILLPHPPFVFSRDGSPYSKETIRFTPQPFNVASYYEAYPEQLMYLNSLTLKLVDQITSGSKTPPIIILQSDHGMDPVNFSGTPLEYVRKRSANFTALLLPGNGAEKFNPSISPVNIFRIIFSHYFGVNLPVVADKVFIQEEAGDEPVLKEVEGLFP